MLRYILVFLSQTLYNIFKVLEIKYTYQNRIGALLLNSVWINLVALLSTYYSVEDLLRGNFGVVFFYIAGSVIGKYIGMNLDHTRSDIWKRLFRKDPS